VLSIHVQELKKENNVSIEDVFGALSDNKALVLFNTIAIAADVDNGGSSSGNNQIQIRKLGLTTRQYYSRIIHYFLLEISYLRTHIPLIDDILKQNIGDRELGIRLLNQKRSEITTLLQAGIINVETYRLLSEYITDSIVTFSGTNG
jgi:hypothetical protein